MTRRAVTLVVVAFMSCVTWKPMHYQPHPERVQDPKAEIRSFVDSNTAPGCVTTSDFTPTTFVAKFVCNQAIGQYLIRFDRVDSISIDQSEGGYRLIVAHREGTPKFELWVKDLEDLQRFADAVAALSALKPTAPKSTAEL